MARTDSKWMPLYIADYLGDTMHLSRAQHGSYLLLLMAYWKRGGPLPDDDIELSAIAKCSPAEWRRDRAYLAKLFQVGGGEWRQSRADRELVRAETKTKAKAEAGAKGAAKRWQTDSTAIAQPMANESLTDAPLPSHSSSDETPANAGVARKPRKPRRTRIADDWKPSEADWAYARKVGLTDGEIEGVAVEFARYWRSGDAKGGGLKSDWAAVWANRVDDQAPRVIGRRPRQPATRSASPSAARDSILAKAGIRRGEAAGVHADQGGWPDGGGPSPQGFGIVIDADGWGETPGYSDRIEAPDTPQSGEHNGLGGADGGVPQAAEGLPGRRGFVRPDDAAGHLAMVACMGGIEGPVGDTHTETEADAGGSDLDLPAFLDRRHKLTA